MSKVRLRLPVKRVRLTSSSFANRAYIEALKLNYQDKDYWYVISPILTREEAELQHAQLIMGKHEKYILKPQ